MSKFKDKLTRLHGSRVRALESEEPGAPRVFVADPVEQPPAPPRVPAAAVEPDRPPVVTSAPDSPARQAMRQQLELGQRVTRPKPRRVVMKREADAESSPEPVRPARREPASDNAIGERLSELRLRAEALITVGGLESALPLLHEMAALSPTHPYPLTQLVRYWRELGNHRIAELYASRLAAVAPY